MSRTAYVSSNTINAAAPKARKAETAAAAPQPEAVHAADVSEDSASWLDKIQQSVDGFMKSVHMPSKTRFIVSTLLSLVACASTLYFSMQLVEMLVVGAMLYTGIGFISFVITFIGVFFALMTAVTAGSKVFDFAMSFEYSNVKSRVSKFFGRFGKKEGTKQ